MNLIMRLALAQLYSASGQKNISLMMKLCFCALMISAFSLTLVVAVMNGFQKQTAKKLQGIHADITIKSPTGSLDYERLIAVLMHEYPTQIVAASPQAYAHLMLRTQEPEQLSPLCVCVGIDPQREAGASTLFNFVLTPHPGLEHDDLLVGKTLANQLQLKENTPVQALYIPEEPQRKKITLSDTPAHIGGIFKTGIEEFDTSVIFCNLTFFKTLFKTIDVSQVILKIQPTAASLENMRNTLAKRFPDLIVYTWKDLYPALVSALALEKYAAFIILALCALIAAMNCMALIFMIITQKKMDIVTLKTLGMRDSDITAIFVLMGTCLTAAATTCGMVLACIASWALERYPIITLPDVYYVDHLPAQIDSMLIITVFCTMMLLGIIASYLPTRKIHTLSLARIIKFGVE